MDLDKQRKQILKDLKKMGMGPGKLKEAERSLLGMDAQTIRLVSKPRNIAKEAAELRKILGI